MIGATLVCKSRSAAQIWKLNPFHSQRCYSSWNQRSVTVYNMNMDTAGIWTPMLEHNSCCVLPTSDVYVVAFVSALP